ncbi:MAG TPA: hypothetical protein VF884_01630 [Nitrososphaeraceae archaeon]
MTATHALTIYANRNIMLDSALHFLIEGLENNEAAVFISYYFSKEGLLPLMHMYGKNCLDYMQKTELISTRGITGLYFRDAQQYIYNQKVLHSWTEMTHEVLESGNEGLRFFVDLQTFFPHIIIEELINCEFELYSALQNNGKSIFAFKIMNGCIESDIVRLTPASFNALQQYHDVVYVVP